MKIMSSALPQTFETILKNMRCPDLLLRYILVVFVYFACVLSPLFPWFPSAHQSTAYINTYTAVFFVTVIIIGLLLLPERRMERSMRASWGESIAWAICGIFILYVLQIAAALINNLILGQPLSSEHTAGIVKMAKTAPLFIFAVSVIGPILEEIVFRKILFGSLKKVIGFIFSAVISSLVFAAGHFDFSHLLIYFVIGFFLCYAYHKTGRIWVTMFMHAAMNTIVVLLTMNVRLPDTTGWIHWLL